jgi:hypothetical protein
LYWLSLAAVAAATIFGLWARIWRRRDASVDALETRMREIEWQTGMRKVIYFGILRRWESRTQLDDWHAHPRSRRWWEVIPPAAATERRLHAVRHGHDPASGWPARPPGDRARGE